jgi:hypothetical protein
MAEESKQKSVAEDYLGALSKSRGSNRETEGLGVMNDGRFMNGSVDEINGRGGEEAPEFVATRHELERLAVHWWTERIDRDFDWFVSQETGSSESRWSVYIDRRLNRLGEILGPGVMRKLFKDAAASFRRRAGLTDGDWRVFTEGTDEEQDAWREKFAVDEEAVTQSEGKALAEAFGAEDAAKAEENQ